MRKLIAAFVGAISASAASAADLPAQVYTKAPVVVAPVYNWTGFYIGLNAGGAWSDSNPTTTTVFSPTGFVGVGGVNFIAAMGNQRINTSGFTGGLTGGYNWQANAAVLGIEADFNYFRMRGSASGAIPSVTTFTVSTSESTDWLATIRGRIGYLVTPALLLYGTGGLAVANVKANYLFTDPPTAANESASISTTRYGWTAGVGGEYALMNGWSIKAEYLYVDLGRASTTSTNLTSGNFAFAWPTNVFTHTVNLTSNLGRIGINYKFGDPSVVKY